MSNLHATYSASHRHIFSLENWDNPQTVLPIGESGIPSSIHCCDQTVLYINNLYHPDFFSKEMVEKNSRYICEINHT